MAPTNYGSYPRISSTAWTHSGQQISYRSLLHFDLTSILPGSTVQSAVLFLNADPAYSSGELSFTVDCGNLISFTISPNPANEVLSISQVAPNTTQKSTSDDSQQSFEVSLLDDSGYPAIPLTQSKDGAQLDLDIKRVKKGQYILQINQGSKTSVHHIQIE